MRAARGSLALVFDFDILVAHEELAGQSGLGVLLAVGCDDESDPPANGTPELTCDQMASFEEGTWIWCPDKEDMYLPGQVNKAFKHGEKASVTLECGEVLDLTEKETDVNAQRPVMALDEQSLKPVENMEIAK